MIFIAASLASRPTVKCKETVSLVGESFWVVVSDVRLPNLANIGEMGSGEYFHLAWVTCMTVLKLQVNIIIKISIITRPWHPHFVWEPASRLRIEN